VDVVVVVVDFEETEAEVAVNELRGEVTGEVIDTVFVFGGGGDHSALSNKVSKRSSPVGDWTLIPTEGDMSSLSSNINEPTSNFLNLGLASFRLELPEIAAPLSSMVPSPSSVPPPPSDTLAKLFLVRLDWTPPSLAFGDNISVALKQWELTSMFCWNEEVAISSSCACNKVSLKAWATSRDLNR
jgi:hypothetical protein